MDKFTRFLSKHKWAIILSIVGILYVLLCIEIGFFRTLLLTVVAGICCYVGISIDKKNNNKMDE